MSRSTIKLLKKPTCFGTLDLTKFLMGWVDLNIGTISGTTHKYVVQLFARYWRFCYANHSHFALSQDKLHLSQIPWRKKSEESYLDNAGAREWFPPLPIYQESPIQTGKKTTEEIRWSNVWLEICLHRLMTQSKCPPLQQEKSRQSP